MAGQTTETGFPLFHLLPRQGDVSVATGLLGLSPLSDETMPERCQPGGYASDAAFVSRPGARSGGCYQNIYGWIGHWNTDKGRRYSIMDMHGAAALPEQFRSVQMLSHDGGWLLLVQGQGENNAYRLIRAVATRLGTVAFFLMDGEYPDKGAAWSARTRISDQDIERLWEQQHAESKPANADNPLDW